MKEEWGKVKEWWLHLNLREKQAVFFGSIIVAIFILYQFIWSPYLEKVADMRQRIVTQQKNLLWMQSADKEIRDLQKHATKQQAVVSPVIFMSVMQKQIDNTGLSQYLTQLKQSTNDAVEVHFQKVEFDKLISLLMTVVKEQQVAVTQMSVVADSTPGIVNADIILKVG